MRDNWQPVLDMDGQTIEVSDRGTVLFLCLKHDQPSDYPGYERLWIHGVVVVGVHPNVIVMTPGYYEKLAGRGMELVEIDELEQLHVLTSRRKKKTQHFIHGLPAPDAPAIPLCGNTLARHNPKGVVFSDKLQVWHLGRTDDTCSSCKAKVRDLMGLGRRRFHAFVTHAVQDDPSARALAFFEDDASGVNASIVPIMPTMVQWPQTDSLTFGSDAWFVANRRQ